MTSLKTLVYGKQPKPWNLSAFKRSSSLTTESTRGRSLLRMLSEAIIDDLLVKYPHHEQVLLQAKIDIDPKFHRWFAKTFDKFANESNQEDLYATLVRLLKDFKVLTDQKRIKGADSDIERYKTVEDLQSAVEHASQTQSKTQQSKGETDILLRDSRFLVASPKTHAASCKLGSNTPWCISTPSNDSYWNDYTEQYELHFVMIHDKAPQAEPDGDNLHKVAVAYSERTGKYEIYDARDKQRDLDDLEDSWGERFEEIWSLVTGSKYNVSATPKTELKIQEIISLVNKGQTEFENVLLFGANMSTIIPSDDAYVNPMFMKSVLDSCRFDEQTKVIVRNSTIKRSEIRNYSKNTAFIQSKFLKSKIESSNMSSFTLCTFEECQLLYLLRKSFASQLPIMNKCRVFGSDFGHVNMTEDQIIQGTTFQDCTFDVWFQNGKIEDCNFISCTFDTFGLSSTKFNNCTFTDCTFTPYFGNFDTKEELLANVQKSFFMTQIPSELFEKLR